jgi:hypothetical protein
MISLETSASMLLNMAVEKERMGWSWGYRRDP